MSTRSRSSWACLAVAVALLFLDLGATRDKGPVSELGPAGIVIPSDARSDCDLSRERFASWFQTGKVTRNGVVDPADSVGFGVPKAPDNNCPFYEWAHRMFLWTTSPAPADAGGGRIFDSAGFYDVSTPNARGDSTLIPHVPGKLRFFPARAAKPDQNGLQIVMSAAGQALEVQPSSRGPHKLPIILNNLGRQVEIARSTIGPSGQPIFYDVNGKIIQSPRPSFPSAMPAKPLINPGIVAAKAAGVVPVQRFVVNGVPIYVDGSGASVPVESGQVDGSVLEAQNGSLIYYAIMVNDVYAYFLTGQKNKDFLATQFPTTQSDLDAITKLAAKHRVKLDDPKALAIELKTSWVETTGLANPSSYITTTATIPTYDTSNPKKWKPAGTKTATLALVGMHISGSVNGHPSMIWSTFEHVDNTPNAAYTYASADGPKSVDENTRGAWLFCCRNPNGPFDQAHMRQSGADIVPNPPFGISPSDTIRWKPWGAASNAVPNPLTKSVADSNAEVISLDAAVMTLLASDDVRANYFMVGATWTEGGDAPTGVFPKGNEVGTNELDNTTLETTLQGTNTTGAGTFGCFSCHNAYNGRNPSNLNLTNMSHIYPAIKPLWGSALSATAKSRTFKPSHELSDIAWSAPVTIDCQGQTVSLGFPGSEFYQAAEKFDPGFTNFFPFLLSVQPTSGSAGFPNDAYTGQEAAVLAVAYAAYWGTPDCSGDFANGSNPPPAATASVNANAGVAFDLRDLAHHTIYSATLTFNVKDTLRTLGAAPPPATPPPATAPPGGSSNSGGGAYYRRIVHRKTVKVTFAPRAGEPKHDRRIIHRKSRSSNDWCSFNVESANQKWWLAQNPPDSLTYDKSGRVAVVATQADSIDVTSLVSRWVAHNDADNNGFIIGNPQIPGIIFFRTFTCVMKLEPTLTVEYF